MYRIIGMISYIMDDNKANVWVPYKPAKLPCIKKWIAYTAISWKTSHNVPELGRTSSDVDGDSLPERNSNISRKLTQAAIHFSCHIKNLVVIKLCICSRTFVSECWMPWILENIWKYRRFSAQLSYFQALLLSNRISVIHGSRIN